MIQNEKDDNKIIEIKHTCVSRGFKFACVEEMGKLKLKHLIAGNPSENEIEVNYCPFCGYLIP